MHILFDLDSTLVTIEGIDELARARGVYDEVAALTNQAMNGDIRFEDVFFRRLDLIRPTHTDLINLGHQYIRAITPNAKQTITCLKKRGVQVSIISGGYNPAVQMVANYVGITHVYANTLLFNMEGNYTGVDRTIPLWKNNGKETIIRSLKNNAPDKYVFVGDSASDLAAGQLVNQFICFTGVVARSMVIQKSGTTIHSLDDLLQIV